MLTLRIDIIKTCIVFQTAETFSNIPNIFKSPLLSLSLLHNATPRWMCVLFTSTLACSLLA